MAEAKFNAAAAAEQFEPPQPPPAYPGPPQQEVPTMTTQPGVTIIVPLALGSQPAHVTCRACNTMIETKVKSKATIRTHLMAAIICLLGFWPCVCLPYCIDSCQSLEHFCPECDSYIGASQ